MNFEEIELLKTFWYTYNYSENPSEEFNETCFHLLIRQFEVVSKSDKDEDLNRLHLIIKTFQYLNGNERNHLLIESNGNFLQEKFKFECHCKIPTLLTKLLEDHLYVNQSPLSQLENVYLLKELKKYGSTTGLIVELNEVLKNKEIFFIDRLKLIPKEELVNGEAQYTFFYRAKTSNGQSIEIENKNFFREENFLRVENTYYIFSEGIAAAAKVQKKLKSLTKSEANDILDNPLSILPQFTNLEKIDLSEYDSRVKGFEYHIPKKQIHLNGGGVGWRERKGEMKPFLSLKSDQGEPIELPITNFILTEIIQKIEINIKNAYDQQTMFVQSIKLNEIEGVDLQCTLESSRDNLARLRIIKEILFKDTKKHVAFSTASTVVPIIEENSKGDSIKKEFIPLTKEELETPLKTGSLKEHQIEGINWMLKAFYDEEGGVLLADDMGLGKTLQILIFISIVRNNKKFQKLSNYNENRNSPSLVVAPMILLSNWEAETQKFIKDDWIKDVFILHGNNLKEKLSHPEGLSCDWEKKYDLIITNYGTFTNHQRELLKKYYSINIFDESQNIKNPHTAKSKASRAIKSNFCICATGTPVENSLKDIWAQISTLNRRKNPLGSYEDFLIEDNLEGVTELRSLLNMGSDHPILKRRDKSLLRTNNTLKEKIELLPKTREMNEFQKLNEELIFSRYGSKPLEMVQKLQKLYQHQSLLDVSEPEIKPDAEWYLENSPKLHLLIEMLDSIKMKNEKVLIFSHFTEMQLILQKVITHKYQIKPSIINGELNSRGKELALKIIKRLSNSKGFDILILSPLAAGAGLNITAANHVIHYGRWWNPSKEDQATDRAYRIGQTKDVYVYYPLLTNTQGQGFDMKLHYKVMERKKELAKNFLMPTQDLKHEDLVSPEKQND